MITSSITEDFENSLELQRRGYRVLFCQDIVAFGLSPHHISGFRVQRAAGVQERFAIFSHDAILSSSLVCLNAEALLFLGNLY